MGESYEIFANANKSLFHITLTIRKAGKLICHFADELSQGHRGPCPTTMGAKVYTGDALAQPVCQGAQTQDTLVVAEVTKQIWFDFFFFFFPLNNIAE